MPRKKGRTTNRYHYTECGLDNIYLADGFRIIESPRGKSVHVQDVEGLHRAIGEMLILEKKTLNAKEFRFLRHELNMTQMNLAALIGVDVQNLGRWERGETGIPGPAQRLVRLLYQEKINNNKAICEPLEKLAEMDEGIESARKINFRDTPNEGWQPAIAA
jgi:putative transcriptional regulator